MAGLGVEKLEKLMPEIVATASKVDIAPHVRDGYIMMFNYLPITFGDKFTPYVGPIIPCILKVGTSNASEEGGKEEAGCHCCCGEQEMPAGGQVARVLSCSSKGSQFSFELGAQSQWWG
jgi:hypothetical protein